MKTGNPAEIIENIKITDLAVNGAGIGRSDKMVLFIKGTVPGDVVDVSNIIKKRKHIEAQPVKFHHKSENRTIPFCKHSGVCGGCAVQHVTYSYQLQLKHKIVRDAFERIGHFSNLDIPAVLPSPDIKFHKNKLEFSFSSSRWLLESEISAGKEITDRNALGFHYPGKFDKIVDIENCFLQATPSNEIRNFARKYATHHGLDFYDIRKNNGFLRSLIIRTSNLGEVMVVIVFGYNDPVKVSSFLEAITKEFPSLTSVFFIINEKLNDSLYDQQPIHYSGSEYIFEQLGPVKIQLGPKSFYQTNSKQSLKLYEVAASFAGIRPDDTVYDLYSGVGSIALFLAQHAKKVIGIETVPESVIEATENSRMNGINHAEFFQGLVENLFTPSFVALHGKADVVIIDPPRPGIHPRVVDAILEVAPEKLVYVSCNPATQARDIALLNQKYEIDRMQPVDMFPHTFHVENVALLKLKKI